ncbi:hypothetical protein D3C79_939750 [compost metagenome]
MNGDDQAGANAGDDDGQVPQRERSVGRLRGQVAQIGGPQHLDHHKRHGEADRALDHAAPHHDADEAAQLLGLRPVGAADLRVPPADQQVQEDEANEK